jgi:hypothetical protein
MLRLIAAEVLKLRRRNGMMAMVLLLLVGGTAVLVAAVALTADGGVRGEGHFRDAIGVLSMTGAVAGVIVGATAGGADIEAGVFRDLAATGRPRLELLLSRVPAAWALLAPPLLVAVLIAAVACGPDASLALAGAATALAAGAMTSAACVGLAALAGSRGTVIGVALAFQLGASPLLAQVGPLGDGRLAIPQVAIGRLMGASELTAGFGVGLALAVLAAWVLAALGAGAWRTTTQEI